MRENGTTSRDDFFSVLQSAEIARDEEIMAPILLDLQRDQELEIQASLEAITVLAAHRLGDRLDFLARHSRLPSWLGGSACKVVPAPRKAGLRVDMLSEPTLGVDAGHVRSDSPQSAIQFGIQYYDVKRKRPSGISHLRIFNVLEEANTGSRKQAELYAISGHPGELPKYWEIRGASFSRFKRSKQHEIYTDFQKSNPWMVGYRVHESGRSWEVERKYGVVISHKREDSIKSELIPQLNPGPDTWQYPDELYHFPLGLLTAANRIFETKQR